MLDITQYSLLMKKSITRSGCKQTKYTTQIIKRNENISAVSMETISLKRKLDLDL